MEKAKKMIKDREQKEMGECTFTPSIIKMPPGIAQPGAESKIQLSETS